jgi:arylformamidase
MKPLPMKYLDLSHWLSEHMLPYPGTPLPSIKKTGEIKTLGYRETSLEITSHTGTHIDAPAHLLEKGRYLGQYPLSKFTGKAVVIKIPAGERQITRKFINGFRKEIGASEFILFHTGWGARWGTDPYYQNYPVLDAGSARYLTSFPLKGIGFDAPSPDPVDSVNYEIHKILLRKDILIIENLVFPEMDDSGTGELFIFPLRIREADGSPARAVLRIP